MKSTVETLRSLLPILGIFAAPSDGIELLPLGGMIYLIFLFALITTQTAVFSSVNSSTHNASRIRGWVGKGSVLMGTVSLNTRFPGVLVVLLRATDYCPCLFCSCFVLVSFFFYLTWILIFWMFCSPLYNYSSFLVVDHVNCAEIR